MSGDVLKAVAAILAAGPEALVLKRGGDGTTVYLENGEIVEAATFPVEVYNVLGAGDAFASAADAAPREAIFGGVLLVWLIALYAIVVGRY